jgi:hypothetical protein
MLQMMKYMAAIGLLGVVLLLAQAAAAQEIAFRGKDIMQLAVIINGEVQRTGALPSSFLMPMANDRTMVVTAANVFEILARAVTAWQTNREFPATVPMRVLDLQGPALDPALEPKRIGLIVAVPTVDIGTYAPVWVGMIEAPGHKVLKGMTFETNYRLTAAQIIVAMAGLITETKQRGTIPNAVAIPLVRSPQDWSDTKNPVPVVKADAPPKVDLEHRVRGVDVTILLNGIELTERGPRAPGVSVLPPFCGLLEVEINGFGPVQAMQMTLDSANQRALEPTAPNRFVLNSTTYTDGMHTLAVKATDEGGKAYIYVFAFTVMNGRQSGFTPAEHEDREIEAIPLDR